MSPVNSTKPEKFNGDRRIGEAVARLIGRVANLAGLVALATFVYQWHKDSNAVQQDILTRIIVLEQYEHLQDQKLEAAASLGRTHREELSRELEVMRRRVDDIDHAVYKR